MDSGKGMRNALEPKESVSNMIAVIDSLGPEHNGKFLNHKNGEEIEM